MIDFLPNCTISKRWYLFSLSLSMTKHFFAFSYFLKSLPINPWKMMKSYDKLLTCDLVYLLHFTFACYSAAFVLFWLHYLCCCIQLLCSVWLLDSLYSVCFVQFSIVWRLLCNAVCCNVCLSLLQCLHSVCLVL